MKASIKVESQPDPYLKKSQVEAIILEIDVCLNKSILCLDLQLLEQFMLIGDQIFSFVKDDHHTQNEIALKFKEDTISILKSKDQLEPFDRRKTVMLQDYQNLA